MNQLLESANTHYKKPEQIRLAYLDGIRGIAALYVVFVHSWYYSDSVSSPPMLWLPMTKLLRYGIFAVVIFIVLSGYCLMLPIVRSDKGYFSGGLLGFFKRRIRRILPPYYAALLLCMLMGGLILWLEQTTNLSWYDGTMNPLQGLFSPNFSGHDLIIYFLLLQNFVLDINNINGPTWTVAVEWQIYFVFAILLIPIWRRLGLFYTVAIAFAVGLTISYLMGSEVSSRACPWFLGLFALGMAAAEINFSQKPSLLRLKTSLPWGILAAIFACLAFLTESLRFSALPGLAQWIVHSFVALGTSCFLIYCTNFLTKGKALPPVIGFLESRWVVALGIFSYSLYITHAPVVWLVHQLLLSQQLSPTMMAAKWLLYAVPSSLLVAYLFHRAFEKPFMSHFSAKVKSQRTSSTDLAKSDEGWDVLIGGEYTGTHTRLATSVKQLLEWLREYMSVDTVTLLLPVRDRQNLAVYATLGLEEEIVQKIRIPIGQGFAGRISASKQPTIVNNLKEVEVVSPILRHRGLRSLVGIPLPIEQSQMGVLHVGTFESHNFTERDVQQLQLIAKLIGSMVADAKVLSFEQDCRNTSYLNSRESMTRFLQLPSHVNLINTLHQVFVLNFSTLEFKVS
ncbi:MAG: acyltransferase family protein [Rhizonema sp. PD38]|nr:acyltransferase family protein [Rhizonema sp. PD38]